MKTVKNILFLIVLLAMILPAAQKEWKLVNEPTLNGDFLENEQPEFSWTGFYNGSFQTASDAWLEQHIGFHNTLVRLRNQLDYSLFNKPNAEGIVLGKEGFVFEYDYISELTGRDFMSYSFIDEKLRRLKYVQHYLKTTKDIDLVLVFMPGKASFYSEYLPDKYLEKKPDSTNYAVYLSEMKKRNIRYIDLNNYFHEFKKETLYPMFPKYGTHWSIYGMSRAAHVWLDSIEQFRGRKLNDFSTDSLYFSTTPLRTDYDGGKALNLLINISKEKFAYPYYVFGHDSSRYKPKVLVIGDSFYWNIFNAGIPNNLFANEAFWYYNRKVYPEFYTHPKYTNELNLKEEVEQKDLIFIMVTERFLNIFDWKLIDQLYSLYTPEYIKEPLYDKINDIVSAPEWFGNVLKKALARGLTPGQALFVDATYMYRSENTYDYMIRYGLGLFEKQLSGSRITRRRLTEKAQKENRPFDEVLTEEARYMFFKQHPDMYRQYQRIKEKELFISNDAALHDSVIMLAEKYYCKPAHMIFYQARLMVEEEDALK